MTDHADTQTSLLEYIDFSKTWRIIDTDGLLPLIVVISITYLFYSHVLSLYGKNISPLFEAGWESMNFNDNERPSQFDIGPDNSLFVINNDHKMYEWSGNSFSKWNE